MKHVSLLKICPDYEAPPGGRDRDTLVGKYTDSDSTNSHLQSIEGVYFQPIYYQLLNSYFL